MRKKIAIIGSGFFGSTCAIMLSKKYDVDLYEKQETILCGASRANQMRFHLGYHYPRSIKTVREIKNHFKDFLNFYGKTVLGNTSNYYGISKEKSKISFSQYVKFLDRLKLKYKIVKKKEFSQNIEGQIKSQEKTLNFFNIKKIILKKLKENNVNIYLNREFDKRSISRYHKLILATYDQNNYVIKKLGYKITKKYQYEFVEKIIVELPKFFRNKSYMVLDGNFICVDPYLGTNYHLVSQVKKSKLEVIKNKFPHFKNYKKKYLNKGQINNKKISMFREFIKYGSNYLTFLKESKYISSFYVTRKININKDKTDERLNEISIIGKKIISIHSGKWNTCVGVARKVKAICE